MQIQKWQMLMIKLPFIFSLYRFFTNIISPFLPAILNSRVKNGKEYENSRPQRFGEISFQKSKNKLIWIHCASVGETMVGILLARKLLENNNDLEFLFTAQTIAAKEVFEKSNLSNSHFQFAPIDTQNIAQKFVETLKPDLAIFVEGEIWPNLIFALDMAGMKRALINARMTDKSIQNWKRFKSFGKPIFSGFSFIHCANEKTENALCEIINSKNHHLTGNLKLSAPALKIDSNLVENIKAQTKGRKIWLCASSHSGEEEIIIDAHKMLLQTHPDSLIIIAPRHINPFMNIITYCGKLGLKTASRSQNNIIDSRTKVLIWDSFGELGSAFKIADCAFIAGSLLPNIGGHNPIEPALLECPIITGPYFHNFKDIYDELLQNHAAIKIENNDAKSVHDAIDAVLFSQDLSQKLINNSGEYMNKNRHMLDKVSDEIMGLL